MIVKLIQAATATGAGKTFVMDDEGSVTADRTFQADGTTSSGAGAATIKVQVSNNNINWLDLATITLTLATTSSSDGVASQASWQYVRGNVTAISGTGASVNLNMGA